MTEHFFKRLFCGAMRLMARNHPLRSTARNSTLAKTLCPTRSPLLSGAIGLCGSWLGREVKNIDAYQGVDVKDKIVVVYGEGLPQGVTRADLTGRWAKIGPARHLRPATRREGGDRDSRLWNVAALGHRPGSAVDAAMARAGRKVHEPRPAPPCPYLAVPPEWRPLFCREKIAELERIDAAPCQSRGEAHRRT